MNFFLLQQISEKSGNLVKRALGSGLLRSGGSFLRSSSFLAGGARLLLGVGLLSGGLLLLGIGLLRVRLLAGGGFLLLRVRLLAGRRLLLAICRGGGLFGLFIGGVRRNETHQSGGEFAEVELSEQCPEECNIACGRGLVILAADHIKKHRCGRTQYVVGRALAYAAFFGNLLGRRVAAVCEKKRKSSGKNAGNILLGSA